MCRILCSTTFKKLVWSESILTNDDFLRIFIIYEIFKFCFQEIMIKNYRFKQNILRESCRASQDLQFSNNKFGLNRKFIIMISSKYCCFKNGYCINA